MATKRELLDQISDLEDENQELQDQLANTNSDCLGFRYHAVADYELHLIDANLGGRPAKDLCHRIKARAARQGASGMGQTHLGNQNMTISFDVYDAALDPANARARRVAVSMSLFNEKGAKAFEAGPLKATELAATRPNAVPVELQVPLKGLASGRLTRQLNVIDEVGRKSAFPRQALAVQ